MDYTLSKSENNQYIVVQVNAPMSRDLAIEIAIEVDQMRKNLNIRNLLYDLRNSENVESITSNYQFAYEDMNKLNLDRSARVAILTTPSDNSHNFIETVIKNAGYNVGQFKEKQLAIAWLEEE